jgi:hypothetical protein
MKKSALIVTSLFCIFILTGVAMAWDPAPPKGMGKGWVEYAYVEVMWDGNPSNLADWWVFNPDGTPRGGCAACLEMDYEFVCVGKTLQFDETYVDVVPAFPQTHHVLLHDLDGDGIYTGWITARYEWPLGTRRMDVIAYEVAVDGGCNVTNFFYREYEYKQKNDVVQ